MRKPILFTGVLLALCASNAVATSVAFFPGFNSKRTVINASGGALSDTNSLVMVGTFSNPGVSAINSQLSIGSNISTVTSTWGWNQFGYDTAFSSNLNDQVTSTLALNSTGNVNGQVTDNNFGATKADFFNAKPLYLWIFNALTVGAATQMGIFRATTAAAPWVFPTNTGFGESGSFSTTSAASGSPVIAALGNFGSTSSSTLQLANFNVAPVPEPSTFAFGLFTALAACSSRKRRSNFLI